MDLVENGVRMRSAFGGSVMGGYASDRLAGPAVG
jgi:hypothetical protein